MYLAEVHLLSIVAPAQIAIAYRGRTLVHSIHSSTRWNAGQTLSKRQTGIPTTQNILYLKLVQFYQDKTYHVYNQGNNKQQIFFTSENYLYFLKTYKTLVAPHADAIAYCLMPNHFHFLLSTNEQSVQQLKVGSPTLSALSNGIRMLLSSYATAINKQQHTTGSLFRQKPKQNHLIADQKIIP